MIAPLARRIACARPVATAIQSRPFTSSPPSNAESASTTTTNNNSNSVSEFKRVNAAELFSEYIDPSARAELSKIRELEDEILSTASMEVPDIDWATWKAEINHPTLVDDLKVMHDATPLADGAAETARLTKVVEETFKPMLAELEQLAAEAETEAAVYEKKAAEISYLHDNVATLPIDEFLEKYPTVKKAIEKDIEEGKWFQDDAE